MYEDCIHSSLFKITSFGSKWKERRRARVYNRNYPLHAATIDGDLDTIKKYLKDVDMKSNLLHESIAYTRRPLEFNHESPMNPTSKREVINVKDNYGKSLLYYAISKIKDSNVRYEVCRNLIQHGADINEYDSENRTFLFKTVTVNDLRLSEQFLKLGADPNIESSSGSTILAQAVSNQNIKMVQLLLNHNANVNDSFAIYLALQRNSCEILWVLFDYGVDLEQFNFSQIKCVVNCKPNLTDMFVSIVDRFFLQSVEFLLESRINIDEAAIVKQTFNAFRSLSSKNKQNIPLYHHSKKMLLTILKYILIRRNYNWATVKIVFDITDNKDAVMDEYEDYFDQLEVMKQTEVHEETNVTYFDLLTKRENKLMKVCSREIIQVLSSGHAEVLFPDFAATLTRNVHKVLRRKIMRENFVKIMYIVFEERLPSELISYVCSFLSEKDLLYFI